MRLISYSLFTIPSTATRFIRVSTRFADVLPTSVTMTNVPAPLKKAQDERAQEHKERLTVEARLLTVNDELQGGQEELTKQKDAAWRKTPRARRPFHPATQENISNSL